MIVSEMVKKASDRISQGQNVFSVLNELNINPTEFVQFLNKNKEMQELFNTARVLGTEKLLLDSIDMIDKADDSFSLLKANSRVKVSQWMAEKLIAPVYGVKQTIEINKTIDIRGALESGLQRVKSIDSLSEVVLSIDEPDILS